MKRIGSLTMVILILAAASIGVAAKQSTSVKRVIMSFTGHPVSGFATLSSTSGKVKKPHGNKHNILAELFNFHADAQTVTVPSLRPQSFEGICDTLPVSAPNGVVAFGMGRTIDNHCDNFGQNISVDGPLVIEDGTLSGLVCSANGSGQDDADGVCEVFVYRKNATPSIIDAGMSCPLGMNTAVFCESPNTFPVITGDRPFGRIRINGGSYSRLQMAFVKE
jgi:hypothetical protein